MLSKRSNSKVNKENQQEAAEKWQVPEKHLIYLEATRIIG